MTTREIVHTARLAAISEMQRVATHADDDYWSYICGMEETLRMVVARWIDDGTEAAKNRRDA